MDLKKKKTLLQISKAETAIMELEFKIMEREADIKRMEDHIELQKKTIKELKEG
jgi:hypothetical protein